MKNLLAIVIVFLVSLLKPTTSTSQNILIDTLITITPTQLKEINLIFNEHEALTKENFLLKRENLIQKELIGNFEMTDSLRLKQLNDCRIKSEEYKVQTDQLNKSLKSIKKKLNIYKFVAGGSILTSILLICLQ